MIKIYPSQRPSKSIEQHPWAGSIGDWFDAANIEYESHGVQPVRVFVDGAEVPPSDWRTTIVSDDQMVEMFPVPFGDIGKLFSSVFKFFFGWLMPSTKSNRGNQERGKELSVAEGRANTARLNQTVPEPFGHIIRYPDYVVQPRRFFFDPKTQYLDMLLCLSPGNCQVNGIPKIGNTPINDIPGAEYEIHPPGSDLSGIEQAQNWYSAPEIGGTSSGTAGLSLTATDSESVNPSGTEYELDGNTITSDTNFPSSWGAGTTMSLMFSQGVFISRIGAGTPLNPYINELDGDWSEINPAAGMMLNCTGVYSGSARVLSVSGSKIQLAKLVSGVYEPIGDLPLGSQSISVSVASRTYSVVAVGENVVVLAATGVPGWAGFSPRTVTAAESSWAVQPGTVYGERAGPFCVSPQGEVTSVFEVDFFFPQGLHTINKDNGRVQNRSVGVLIEYRDEAAGGLWLSVSKTYTQATMDQIGFTERIVVPTPIRPEIRVRRRGARSTDAQVQDEVQWYAGRCLLAGKSSYPWTTMSVRVRGLGQIAASSENQVNIEITRILPTLLPDGSIGPEIPTRDISAALLHVCNAIGYGVDNIDIPELLRLHNIWTSRGETFDAVISEKTVQQALETILGAGMAELSIEDGKIRPVRDGLRTIAEQSYSAQNTKDFIARTFTAHRDDDNDGVEVEYMDGADGWSTHTVECYLPGSLRQRLEKIKLEGVTDRTRAWRIGMRRARYQRFIRWSYDFSTELDAMNSQYGGFVSLIGDQSAILVGISGAPGAARLQSSEPLRWIAGESHVVALRRPDGTITPPHAATRGADDYEVLAPIPSEDWPTVTLDIEPPHLYFGPTESWRWPAIIKSVKPSSNDTCSVQAVNYDPRVFADDDSTPPT